MNGKKVRLITVLAAALLMQLAVVGAAQAQRLPRSLPGHAVEPLDAWFGPKAGGVVIFEIDDDEVYMGPVFAGAKLLSIRNGGKRFYDGDELVASVRHGRLVEGANGRVLMSLRENRIHAGQNGPRLYEMRGDRLFDDSGRLMLTTSTALADANAETRLVVALVLERYFVYRAPAEQ